MNGRVNDDTNSEKSYAVSYDDSRAETGYTDNESVNPDNIYETTQDLDRRRASEKGADKFNFNDGYGEADNSEAKENKASEEAEAADNSQGFTSNDNQDYNQNNFYNNSSYNNNSSNSSNSYQNQYAGGYQYNNNPNGGYKSYDYRSRQNSGYNNGYGDNQYRQGNFTGGAYGGQQQAYGNPQYYGQPRYSNNYPPNAGFYAPVKKIYDKTDRRFSVYALIAGFIFVWFIFVEQFRFGVGASVYFISTLFMSYFYVLRKKLKIDWIHNAAFVFLIILSIPFSIYSNRLVLAMDFAVLFFGTSYWVYSSGGKERKHFSNTLTDFLGGTLGYPFMNYGSMFPAMFSREKGKKHGNAKWIILGLLIAIPIVSVVSALLLESDEMFRVMFSFIFDNFISKLLKYILYAVVGIPLAMAVFSCWYTKYDEEQRHKINQNRFGYTAGVNLNKKKSGVAPAALMYAIAFPLCVVYLLYLISQVAYFISFLAENLLPKDFTIVDYARNGFFELCVVSVINIIIILLLFALTIRTEENSLPVGIRVITVIMSLFTMIFISTALYKMFMYIQQYGYTAMRINTSIFMFFLMIVFVLTITKQFIPGFKLFPSVVVCMLVFLTGYNLADTDAFIARENIRLYEQKQIGWMGSRLVEKLDDSAFEYIIPFAEKENNGLTKQEQESLEKAIMWKYYWNKGNYDDMAEHFPSFNVSRFRIYKMLENYYQNHKDVYDKYYGYNSYSHRYDDYDDYDDYYDYDYDADYAYSYSYDEV